MKIAYVAVPLLFTLVLYWPGLLAWFQKDDFAWLGLRWGVHSWRDLAWALFAPHTEGTLRPWSHGAFFLSLSAIFGVRAFPFRAVAFLTQFANLILLSSVTFKLTASRAAGFWAAMLWTANSALATAMSWTMAYNTILGAFFLLLAFRLFLRYTEAQDWRYYAAQFVVFVLGFGALETNLVYPVLVGAYALSLNRRYLGKVVPLFLVSLAYVALHIWVTPVPASGPYRGYFDASIFSTLWMYWKAALGPNRLILLGIWPSRWRSLLTALLMLALLGFLIDRLRRRDWPAVVFPIWFVASLVPVLPFRDHFDTLYLTIPTIGLAMWGAWAAVSGWRAGAIYRLAATVAICIYLAVSLPVARVESRAFYTESIQMKRLVLAVVDAARKDPGSLVLLAGVDDKLFDRLIYYRPFGAFGMWDVYLTPESRTSIHANLPADVGRSFFPDPDSLKQASAEGKLQILDISGGAVRDITPQASPTSSPP